MKKNASLQVQQNVVHIYYISYLGDAKRAEAAQANLQKNMTNIVKHSNTHKYNIL